MTTTIGVSLKMYFGHVAAVDWFGRVIEFARDHDDIELIVFPSFVSIPAAVEAFRGTGITVGAQDLHWEDSGAFTGEVSGAELAELGVGFVEVGHAERRRLFGETDEIVARKTTAAIRNGLVPLLCIGETEALSPEAGALVAIGQLEAALANAPHGRVIVAYEPVWAIGAAEPADPVYIREVCHWLRRALKSLPGREGSSVIYGGSAGPGLLGQLENSVDGLFLGRFAHDPAALSAVLVEASGR